METEIDLVKIKEHFPYNYHNIIIIKHEKALVIDMSDALSVPVPNVQNEKSFYRSFYKSISDF